MNAIEKTHVSYIASILTSIIIILVTVRFADVPNLSERLNFGLTVSSLILAILAIIYAIYSNSSLIKNSTVMNEAARDISATSRALSSVVTELTNTTEPIPSKLQSIEEMLSKSSEAIAQNPIEDKLEEPSIEKLQAEAALELSEKVTAGSISQNVEKVDPDELVKAFTGRASIDGLIICYALIHTYERKVPMNLPEFMAATEVSDVKYASGFVVGIHAMNLINIVGLQMVFNITRMTRRLKKDGIKEELERRGALNSAHALWISSKLKIIDDYFETTFGKLNSSPESSGTT
jgi:uncharacterized protein YoxC